MWQTPAPLWTFGEREEKPGGCRDRGGCGCGPGWRTAKAVYIHKARLLRHEPTSPSSYPLIRKGAETWEVQFSTYSFSGIIGNGQEELTLTRGNDYCTSASEHMKRDQFVMKCTCNVKSSSWTLSPPSNSPPITPHPPVMLFTLSKPTWSVMAPFPSLLPQELAQCPTLPL